MGLNFERGEKSRARGHALLYFRNSMEPDEIWATYLVVLPVSVDIAKYVPPFLASQVADIGAKELSAFAFPPAPEKLGSHEELVQLAESRDDDVLDGGTTNPADVTSVLYAVNETVREYSQAYFENQESRKLPSEKASISDLDVNQLVYSLMSEQDRLGELSRTIGKLRFAIDGGDQRLIQEVEEEIQVLAGLLPESYSMAKLIAAAKTPGDKGAKLADLYMKRCYSLAQQQFENLAGVEQQIAALESNEE